MVDPSPQSIYCDLQCTKNCPKVENEISIIVHVECILHLLKARAMMDNIFLSHSYILVFPPKSLFSITLILICITLSLVTLLGNNFSFYFIALRCKRNHHFFACWLVFMLKGLNRFLTGFVCRSLLCHTPTQAKCSLSAAFETQWVSIGTQVAW